MIKAIFFDIDGTLISKKRARITAPMIDAFEQLRSKGIYLFIATGRHRLELEEEKLLEGVYFDGFITLNGQYCYNNKEVIYRNAIHKEDIQNIINQINHHPYPCMFLEEDRMYINMINEAVKKAQHAIYTSIPPITEIRRALENPVYQIVSFLEDDEAQKYPLSIIKHSKSTRWNAYAIDIVPKSGNKREGICKVLEYYNIPVENTMAFGDGDNDIEMLQYVGIGIAMGNAEDTVKKAADFITLSVEEDGILSALEQYGLLS